MESQDILKYIDGELSEQDKSSFEAKLKLDDDLAKEVAAMRQMKSYASTRAEETKAILASKKIHQAYKSQEHSKSKNNSILKYLIPLAVAAMVVLGIFIQQESSSGQLSNSELYAIYFTPTDLPLVNRSAEDQSLEEKAEFRFKIKDYRATEEIITEIIQLKGESGRLKLYKAICLMQIGRQTEAEDLLKSLTTNPQYETEAHYFLALLNIRELDNEVAATYLQKIDAQSNRYKEAKELIEQLSR